MSEVYCQNISLYGHKLVTEVSNLSPGLTYEFKVSKTQNDIMTASIIHIQVRARTSVGYGPYSTAEEVMLSIVSASNPSLENLKNGDTVAATSAVLGVLGWIILVAIIVAISVSVIRHIRHQRTKTLRL